MDFPHFFIVDFPLKIFENIFIGHFPLLLYRTFSFIVHFHGTPSIVLLKWSKKDRYGLKSNSSKNAKKHSFTLKSITNKGTFECNNIVEAEVHTLSLVSQLNWAISISWAMVCITKLPTRGFKGLMPSYKNKLMGDLIWSECCLENIYT